MVEALLGVVKPGTEATFVNVATHTPSPAIRAARRPVQVEVMVTTAVRSVRVASLVTLCGSDCNQDSEALDH